MFRVDLATESFWHIIPKTQNCYVQMTPHSFQLFWRIRRFDIDNGKDLIYCAIQEIVWSVLVDYATSYTSSRYFAISQLRKCDRYWEIWILDGSDIWCLHTVKVPVITNVSMGLNGFPPIGNEYFSRNMSNMFIITKQFILGNSVD